MSQFDVDPINPIEFTVSETEPVNLTPPAIERIIEGISPTVDMESVEGGTLLTITDKNGPHQATIYNGEKGDQGEPGEQGEQGEKGDPGDISGILMNGSAVAVSDQGIANLGTVITDVSGKVDKQQAVEDAGKALGINDQGVVVPVPFSGDDFTGATASTAGVHGYVPAPAAGDQGKALFGDGTWKQVADPSDMVGATSSANGVHGLVPAPLIAERAKFLCGDGTWALPEGGKLVVFELDTVTNTSGSYTHTTTLTDCTHDMKAVVIEVSDSTVFGADINITTADGSITLSCDSVSGTSDVTVSCLFIANANTVTSSEFDVLANRIGTLSSLTTTNKSDLVSAVNEVNGNINSLSLALANKVTIQTLDNITINSGYFIVNYPSGISYNSHCILIYQRYASGHNAGYVFTIQPQSNALYVYARNPVNTNGMPPDGSKVSVTVVYIMI